jgi:hypothetical protein
VLQPEFLEQIWTDILEKVNNIEGLMDFREPQIFFSAKGTKLLFKTSPSRPTLLDAMENFESYFERVVDTTYVRLNKFFVDIGKEICPKVSLIPLQHAHVGDEAQVYSWKRCCLESYIKWMYDGEKTTPSKGGPGQRFYEQNLLYEACNMTSLTPKRSILYSGGLRYSQFYGSVKEVSDVMQLRPFENDSLEEMALDPTILKGARSIIRGHGTQPKVIENAYLQSKRRARFALEDSERKSFGLREEHRVTWPLFQGVRSRLLQESREQLEVFLDDCPPYAWPVQTKVYLDYIRRNVNKFAAGFEIVKSRCRPGMVSWEETKTMAMFLRCLRFVFAAHTIKRENALWCSRRERSFENSPQVQVWIGLGFCNTLSRYGYCWLEPRIDWDRLAFYPDVTDNVMFGNGALRSQYLRRGGEARHFFDTTRRMELAIGWLQDHHHNPPVRTRLLSWMVHLCLQQFRTDVLSAIPRDIKEDRLKDALLGEEPFCHDYLTEIMREPVYVSSGNRGQFPEPQMLFEYLFHFDDGKKRKCWEHRAYRTLYTRVKTILTQTYGALRLFSKFERKLKVCLFDHHWLLPYPSDVSLIQKTKESKRMWYAINFELAERDTSTAKMGDKIWSYAKAESRAGRPNKIPRFVSWSKEEWTRWLERQRAYVVG